ncbi:MAG TPA: hypothetical protein VJS90_08440 [Pseudomonas sp.]|uniref:hypothetical protein n=1 Tax=Pseudomonas sp. TaxID=306 RepID=UPI002B45B3F6|nr:hypothetical protein [Pseudomonas sp.]HKS13055.1 hypothetical protein [Pseudomonas sp.]
MIHARTFALLALVLAVVGCSPARPYQMPSDPKVPALQNEDDQDLRLNRHEPCRRRGCDDHKLFFNPAQPEPDVNSINRGW